jgi:hypothetical protein
MTCWPTGRELEAPAVRNVKRHFAGFDAAFKQRFGHPRTYPCQRHCLRPGVGVPVTNALGIGVIELAAAGPTRQGRPRRARKATGQRDANWADWYAKYIAYVRYLPSKAATTRR